METATKRRTRRATWLAAAVTSIAIGAFAAQASAHTAPIVADCDSVRVVLTDYNPAGVNSVTVYIDGSLRNTTTFGADTSATYPFTDPTVSHTWRVVVSAWDDPTGSNGWSFDTGTRSVGVCATATTAAPSITTAPAATTTQPPAVTVPGPTTPTTIATVASVVVTAPPAGPATTAVVAQAAPTTTAAPVAPTAPAPSTPTPTVASAGPTGGTLPVTGSDAHLRLLGYALLAFGFGILVLVAVRRPADA